MYPLLLSCLSIFFILYILSSIPLILVRSVSRLFRLVAACCLIGPVLLNNRVINCVFISPPPGATTAGCRASSIAGSGPVNAAPLAPVVASAGSG